MTTKILVCGGRDYTNASAVDSILTSALNNVEKPICIIQGGALGADTLAKLWGIRNGVPVITMDANWPFYNKAAGSIRNKWMLDFCEPDLVIAFPGGSGTKDMLDSAKAAGVTTYVPF